MYTPFEYKLKCQNFWARSMATVATNLDSIKSIVYGYYRDKVRESDRLELKRYIEHGLYYDLTLASTTDMSKHISRLIENKFLAPNSIRFIVNE